MVCYVLFPSNYLLVERKKLLTFLGCFRICGLFSRCVDAICFGKILIRLSFSGVLNVAAFFV